MYGEHLDLEVLELDSSLDFTVTAEVLALWKTSRDSGYDGDRKKIEDWLESSRYARLDTETGEWMLAE